MLKLNIDKFESIIECTPLVSVDFIVENNQGEILLGKRNNRPAKGFWFVPGGRILKDESLNMAFYRLIKEELNIENLFVEPEFLGIYQHFYDDNVTEKKFSTHYVVLAYTIKLSNITPNLPKKQHSQYHWFSKKKLLESNEVHEHSKWYFLDNKKADTVFNKAE